MRRVWRKSRSESIRCRKLGFISCRGFQGHGRATAADELHREQPCAATLLTQLLRWDSQREILTVGAGGLCRLSFSLPRETFWFWGGKKKSLSSWMVCLNRTWSLNVALLNCDQSTYLPCDLGEQGKTLPTAAAVVFQHPVCARAAKCSRLCLCPGGSQHRWEVKKYKYYCAVLTYCT